MTPAPDDYVAHVRPVGTGGIDEIIERMIQRGSTVTRADIVGVLEEYHATIEEMLLDGMNVTTPLANFSVSIRGVFNGADDRFDPARHRLRAVVRAGARLRKALQERGQAVKEDAVKPAPNPVDYIDLISGERNSTLTPGGMGRIIGNRLKFDPTDPQQGIFFIAEDGTEWRVATVGRNVPGELLFLVPDDLTAGAYRLEVRTIFRGRRHVRKGMLDATLVVS